MLALIARHRPEIAALCRRYGVRRLEVFGSAARGGDFDARRSDVDFLVEFDPHAAPPSLAAFIDLRRDLEHLLQRPVDLVSAGAVRNPYTLAAIERSRKAVYAA